MAKQKPKFKNKQLVLVKLHGDTISSTRYSVGIITSTLVARVSERERLKQDGLFGEATGPVVEKTTVKYMVNTLTSKTNSLVDEDQIQYLENHKQLRKHFVDKQSTIDSSELLELFTLHNLYFVSRTKNLSPNASEEAKQIYENDINRFNELRDKYLAGGLGNE